MPDYLKILNNNLLNVIVDILKDIEKNGLDGNNHLYISFKTNNPKNIVPNWLLQKYPNEMTIVIQHEYYHLSVNKNDFSVGLSFNNKKSDLKISFDSITSFADPSDNFGLNYQFNKSDEDIKKEIEKKKNKNLKNNKINHDISNVIDFSNFKKN